VVFIKSCVSLSLQDKALSRKLLLLLDIYDTIYLSESPAIDIFLPLLCHLDYDYVFYRDRIDFSSF
jgi:hypothetical protein